LEEKPVKQKILVIGSADVNISMDAAQLPEPGEIKTDNGSLTVTNGGKASNVAVAMSRLGAKSVLAARVGDDAYGKRLMKLYNESKIDTSYVEIDRDFRTGVSVTIKERDKDARRILYRGANMNFTPEDALRAMSCEPEAFYVDLELSYPIAETTLKYAKRHEIPIFFNASPANKDYPLSSLPALDIFFVSDKDIEEYTGITAASAESALRAAVEIQKHVKATYYVVRLGEKGAFVYDGKYYHMVSSYIVRAIDTAASNDIFAGAMLLEYTRNSGDIISACKYANAAVALSVQKAGTTASMPYHEDVMAFIAKKDFITN
jgi:ribokinase